MYFKKVNARRVLNTGFIYGIYVNYFPQLKEIASNVDSIDNALSLRIYGSKIVLKQEQQTVGHVPFAKWQRCCGYFADWV